MLPTNPWCAGIPGGDRGPMVLDFATSKIAGGWIYAVRSAGALLPEGCVIDAEGNPTREPEDYFNGGAILPAGGQIRLRTGAGRRIDRRGHARPVDDGLTPRMELSLLRRNQS